MTLACAKCDQPGHGTPDALPEGWESHVSKNGASFPVCPACLAKGGRTSRGTGDASADQLRLLIERIERIEEEIKGAQDDRKDVYSEAKATGYDTKVMKEIVKRRKMDGHTLLEFEGLLEAYSAALGLS